MPLALQPSHLRKGIQCIYQDLSILICYLQFMYWYIIYILGTTNLITSVINYGKPMAEKIDKFIALAPAVYVGHSKGLMRVLANFARLIQVSPVTSMPHMSC